jgi:hypothetical protein
VFRVLGVHGLEFMFALGFGVHARFLVLGFRVLEFMFVLGFGIHIRFGFGFRV